MNGHAPAQAAASPQIIPAGERVIISTKPSLWFVVLESVSTLVVLGLLAAAVAWVGTLTGLMALRHNVLLVFAWLAVAKLMWEFLDWACRSYVLTERRVIRAAGIVRRYVADVPLERIQQLTLFRGAAERILGLGTIGFESAGTSGVEAFWISVRDPRGVLETVRSAMTTAGGGGGLGDLSHARGGELPGPGGPARAKPVVIGIAGGIGAGKSAVAAEFARLGAVVIDSDKEAKESLERPDVQEALARWWGPGVIEADGRVDRKSIARIVFTDPEQRRRLEGLVHPLVRRARAAAVEEARRAGKRLVIVDAPLLFEAGVDKECDAVVFVDAPWDVRAARLRSTRGWDEVEMMRRESQQWKLEEKKKRSQYLIENAQDVAAMRRQVAQVYQRVVR